MLRRSVGHGGVIECLSRVTIPTRSSRQLHGIDALVIIFALGLARPYTVGQIVNATQPSLKHAIVRAFLLIPQILRVVSGVHTRDHTGKGPL